MNSKCESCLMPFSKDCGRRENNKYCSFCYQNGEFRYKGSYVKGFQKIFYDNMIAKGSSKLWAKFASWSVKFAPRWKNKYS